MGGVAPVDEGIYGTDAAAAAIDKDQVRMAVAVEVRGLRVYRTEPLQIGAAGRIEALRTVPV